MTRRIPTTQELTTHARLLALDNSILLFEADDAPPDLGLSAVHQRRVFVRTITDETSYAVALHEMGHVGHPRGFLRTLETEHDAHLKVQEEENAWFLARSHALDWTVAMEMVYKQAIATYYEAARREVRKRTKRATETVSDFLRRRG